MHSFEDLRQPLIVAAILLAAVGFGSACAGGPPRAERLEISRVYLAGGIADTPAALYATIDNPTSTADTLVAVTVSVADRVELHTQMRHGEGMGAMVMMAPVTAIPVPAGAVVRLAPGGYHGMVTGLRRPVAPGDTVDATFRFSNTGTVAARAVVARYGDLERLLDDGAQRDDTR
jgi:copper(I)-binding protein